MCAWESAGGPQLCHFVWRSLVHLDWRSAFSDLQKNLPGAFQYNTTIYIKIILSFSDPFDNQLVAHQSAPNIAQKAWTTYRHDVDRNDKGIGFFSGKTW